MRAIAVWLAACYLAVSFVPRSSLAAPDEKAVLRAMEQQRKAAEAEMRRQAEYEKKVMEQQNRAMQEQAKAEQRMMREQQKAMQNQQKTLQNQQKVAQHQSTTQQSQANPAHITTTATASPVYHAARPYYGHSSGHAYHRTTYRTYRTMPTQLNPQTRALLRLKASLEHVRMGSPATPAEKTAIKKALMGVVEVPKVPTIASLQTLSSHLADGLANRASSVAQTGPMALTLRGALNSSEVPNIDLTEIMNEHRTALKGSKVRPTEITPIMDSLRTVANQERSRR
jgi:hypothetical protein